ncbi:MAG: deoxyguanosinetriphosphate triphosphohydrolase, partial [Rhodobacteraceae bacterium]
SPSLEAQVASIGDDIAYNSHDLDDGLRANLFKFEDIITLPIIDEAYDFICAKYPKEGDEIKQKETLRLFFNNLVINVIKQTQENLNTFFDKSVKSITSDDIKDCKSPVVSFSDNFIKDLNVVRSFLFKRMYRHEKVALLREKAKIVVKDLFSVLMEEPSLMPKDWAFLIQKSQNAPALHRLVSDYVSGMTDRYAIQEHSRLTGLQIFR